MPKVPVEANIHQHYTSLIQSNDGASVAANRERLPCNETSYREEEKPIAHGHNAFWLLLMSLKIIDEFLVFAKPVGRVVQIKKDPIKLPLRKLKSRHV